MPTANMQEDSDNKNEKKTAIWTDPENKALLEKLSERKDTHMSSNGFKPQVWTFVVKKLKKIYDLYVFVKKFSDNGWDEENKYFTNAPQHIEDFVKKHGPEYKHCFSIACPYQTELDALYSGSAHKATGENVVQLAIKKPRCRNNKNTMSNVTASSSLTPLEPISKNPTLEAPIVIDNDTPSHNNGSPANPFDDELGVMRLAAHHTQNEQKTRARTIDDEGVISKNNVEGKTGYWSHMELKKYKTIRKKTDKQETLRMTDDCPMSMQELGDQRSDDVEEYRRMCTDITEGSDSKNKKATKHKRSDSGGLVRRNTEAGTQISRALENLSSTLALPLVTSDDFSYIYKVVNKYPEGLNTSA
ncbi:hypothetical protein B0H19DRAFT_1058941 [Mycena capillaripes]|nr:hypothetical protein B0H19DRAFT_1058941 [Mycena capillaripes]